jgi:tetratricopeptide (TPR) repeat protein
VGALSRTLGGLFACLVLAAAGPTFASSADELVREARVHEADHKEELAMRRYTEALALDPTLGDAYLGLGELRARRGDAREAERVYSVALEHVPQLRAALLGRARARWAMGLHEDAERDLSAYASGGDEKASLRELAGWFGEDGRAPAQLAVWRRLVVVAERTSDAPLARESRTMVRALQILVGPADPVSAPNDGDDVRRALARMARRGG